MEVGLGNLFEIWPQLMESEFKRVQASSSEVAINQAGRYFGGISLAELLTMQRRQIDFLGRHAKVSG